MKPLVFTLSFAWCPTFSVVWCLIVLGVIPFLDEKDDGVVSEQ